MDRARFLAIRDELSDEWQPRNGIERTLIDTMAQAQTTFLFWIESLTLRATLESELNIKPTKEDGKWTPPRVMEYEAIEQSAAMADRFNRMFLRAVRSLRDLRRHSPNIIVKSAGQVNVGQQQVNVSKNGKRRNGKRKKASGSRCPRIQAGS